MEKKRMSSFKLHTGDSDGRQLGKQIARAETKGREGHWKQAPSKLANEHANKYASQLFQRAVKQARAKGGSSQTLDFITFASWGPGHGISAETRDRTGDLQIFSLTLSQLSYRGLVLAGKNALPGQGANAWSSNRRKAYDLSSSWKGGQCMEFQQARGLRPVSRSKAGLCLGKKGNQCMMLFEQEKSLWLFVFRESAESAIV